MSERQEEQRGPKCLPWCPHVHMTLGNEDSSLGDLFAHLEGFPTVACLPKEPSEIGKRSRSFHGSEQSTITFIERKYTKISKYVGNKHREQ